MGDKLKAGAMGPVGWVGTPPEFSNSMAAAIEKALNDALAGEGKPTFPTNDNSAETRDRRVLFVAIAQGVTNYLKQNEAAFVVNLEFDGLNVTDATIEIEVE